MTSSSRLLASLGAILLVVCAAQPALSEDRGGYRVIVRKDSENRDRKKNAFTVYDLVAQDVVMEVTVQNLRMKPSAPVGARLDVVVSRYSASDDPYKLIGTDLSIPELLPSKSVVLRETKINLKRYELGNERKKWADEIQGWRLTINDSAGPVVFESSNGFAKLLEKTKKSAPQQPEAATPTEPADAALLAQMSNRKVSDSLLVINTRSDSPLPSDLVKEMGWRWDEHRNPPVIQRAFNRPDVLVVHPMSKSKPAVVDFSRMTLGTTGKVIIHGKNGAGGNSLIKILKSGQVVEEKKQGLENPQSAFNRRDSREGETRWERLEIAYSKEPLVMEIHAEDYYFEWFFFDYQISGK